MEAAIMPQPGADYPLVLGQTLRDQPADLCYVRYDFKPASVARQGEGSMSIAGSEVALALPNSNGNGSQGEHHFCGNFEHSKDDMDCVLVFDGRSFRMEALAGRINNLRHVRQTQRTMHRPHDNEPAQRPDAAQAVVANTAHGPAPKQDTAAADDSWDFRPSATVVAEAASPAAAEQSESSARSGSSSGDQSSGVNASEQLGMGDLDPPSAGTAAAAVADTSGDPPGLTAAAAAATVPPGRAPPPGAEDLTAEELAFFGYTEAPQDAAAAAHVAAAEQPASGNSSDDSSSDGGSSDSDSDGSNDALGHAAADAETI